LDGPLPKLCSAVTLSHQDGSHSAVALLLKAALIQVSDYRLLGASGLPNLQLNIGKKYLKTAIIIDESLIHAIVSRNYSTKPSYISQLKHELKVWKYIFNLFHFEVLIQNRNLKFRSLSLFVLTFHEYKAGFVFGFRLDYKLSLFIFFFVCVKLFCVLYMCYNQYIS
jgi:hypothetical protein